MPMLREDDLGRGAQGSSPSQPLDSAPIPIQTPPGMRERWLSRRLSEESIRTELCEGPAPDSPPSPATPQHASSRAVSDRSELIERLKRGESPTWIPSRHLESLLHQNNDSPPPQTPQPPNSASPGLLPAPTITPERPDGAQGQQAVDSALQEGLNIERPRSALHSGNFTPAELSPSAGTAENAIHLDCGSGLHGAPGVWMSTSPPRDFTPFSFTRDPASYRRETFGTPGLSLLSSSLSSSFVYKPPTSPLVRSETNDELDLTLPLNSFNIDSNSPRSSRRHTLNFAQSPFANLSIHRQPPLRREGTYPYQAHQPRRSLNSTPSFASTGTSPQTPALSRPRRPSFSSEASPVRHASMVGSYEESILRGRMSTTPSKPLEFLAQIGVLGLGKCKPSLRCPAHVTLPFSAVFYSYPNTSYGRSEIEGGPSPYVGLIDLENGLPNLEDGQRARRKLQSRYQDLRVGIEGDPIAHDIAAELSEGEGAAKPGKPKRRSRSPKAPPGGGYRIPEKGQLQVIIKNQNKTAVKLFLVPYDLAGMEPGSKTFIRQRSYSAGPIIDAPNAKDLPTVADRPTLRYLIHIHICCPSKGRYYLYRSLRVVFANRVPDGKEKLRNEVTHPDPRFTPYKPVRVMHPPSLETVTNTGTPSTAALAAERAFRRRSAGFSFSHGHSLPQYNQIRPFHNREPPAPAAGYRSSQTTTDPTCAASRGNGNGNGITSYNTEQELSAEGEEKPFSTGTMVDIEMACPPPTINTTILSSVAVSQSGTHHNNNTPDPDFGLGTYGKLSKGDIGYGGNAFSRASCANTRTATAAEEGSAAPAPATTVTEGLLSKRLRSLGVQGQAQTQTETRPQHP